MYQERIKRVLDSMEEMGLDQMLVSDPDSIWYLTGYDVFPFERLFAFYLRRDGHHKLFLNRLFPVPEAPYEQVWSSDTDDAVAILASHVDGKSALGIDKEWPARFLLPLMERNPDSRYIVASDCVDHARACKDEAERELMRAASRINDTVMERAAAFLQEGITEREVADYIISQYAAEGCDSEAFQTIVSFGPNAADPHHEPDDTVLKVGDCIVIDMGCKKARYCSDMTRTVALGHATEEMRKVYDTVLRAQLAGIAASHAGASGKSIDGAARDIITEAGYGPYFGHSYGHSLGLEIHEAPNCTPRNENPIPAGAVCSAEPGIYIPGKFGVRIEDVVIFREGGCEVITHSPKELTIL